MKRENRKGSIILKVAVLFLIGVVTTGFLTYYCETRLSDSSVKRQTELQAGRIAEEAKRAVFEFPAYGELIRYWYSNFEGLDVEYDAELSGSSATAEQCREFSARHPELQLRYVTDGEFSALPEEDKKLYAQIAYSWLITRADEIKQTQNADYLFCVISEEPYNRQFFLFSAAEPGAVRGTSYEEVYPLGHSVEVAQSQSAAMREATLNSSHLADAGNYVDYYTSLCSFDGHSVLIGLTYDLSDMKADIGAKTRTGATLAIINQLVLSAICLALIYAFVIRPLKKVQSSIREYKNTKESGAAAEALAGVRSHDEIGHLAADVTEMVREIDDHMDKIRSITAEKERIGTELALATRIQAAMLPGRFPAFPERNEFDVFAVMDPAKEVGGDFYDFFLLDDDRLALVIADVSGKGVPAALFMMVSKILIKNYAMTGLSPAKTLEAVNRQICANNPEQMFVTVWLGILEISTGRLTCSNAGHEYPATAPAGGEFALVRDKHGFVIGGMDGMRYTDYELCLEPGAKLFVYTDGVPEASDSANALFGTERMLSALNEVKDGSPQEVLRRVRERVDGFAGEAEQFDDLTMLCLEYRGVRG